MRIIVATIGAIVLIGGAALFWSQKGGNESAALASGVDSTAVATGEHEDGKKKEEVRVPVEIAAAQERDLPSYFQTTGSLEARRQVELISKAQGQVTALRVEEGDEVREGQVLLEIEHQEEALLESQAEVKAQTAEAELSRTEDMVKQGLVTDREYDERKQNAEVAAFERELAHVRLQNKIVRAPFDGRITTRNIERGQTVSVGETLVGIADVSPMEVKLFLPERVVHELAIGQPVEIRPDVAQDEVLTGTVDRIAPVVDAATSTVKVTLRVDEPGKSARVGSFVRARITTDVHESAVAVPKKALVPEAGATYVFVAEADSVRKVAVETRYADDEYIEILEGISLGERVVVVGQGGLRQGTKIRDLSAPEATGEVAEDVATEVADAGSR